jgi:hypothetical protein
MTEEKKTQQIVSRAQKDQYAEQEAEAWMEDVANGDDLG